MKPVTDGDLTQRVEFYAGRCIIVKARDGAISMPVDDSAFAEPAQDHTAGA
jgi:hypothetical protein